NAPGAALAGNLAHGSLSGGGGEAGHLLLGDFAQLCLGNGGHLGLVGDAGTALNAQRLHDAGGGGGRLGDKGEAAVGIDGDDHGDLEAGLNIGEHVELHDKLKDVQAGLA